MNRFVEVQDFKICFTNFWWFFFSIFFFFRNTSQFSSSTTDLNLKFNRIRNLIKLCINSLFLNHDTNHRFGLIGWDAKVFTERRERDIQINPRQNQNIMLYNSSLQNCSSIGILSFLMIDKYIIFKDFYVLFFDQMSHEKLI